MSQTRQTSGLTTSTSHYTSSRSSNSPSIKALQLEYAKLQKEPVEGFTVKLDDDSNLYKWHGKQKKKILQKNFLFLLVGIFGPPDTLYEGGYFKADMEFPTTYPFAPPKVNKIYVNPFK
jgi:ubiquitin-conjugating enzyme E2 R